MYEVNKNVEKIIMGKETNFLDYNMQELVKRKLGKISYNVYKPYQDSEKVIYYTQDLPKVLLYEIKANSLKHQDILGTLFSLGIDSSMYGDILIIDNHYYIYILEIMENYLLLNLNMIKNQRIELIKKNIDDLKNYERTYENIELIVSSVRLDNVVAKLTCLSRDNAIKKIKDREVLVNYSEVKYNYNLNIDDIISIRKYGKYKYMGIVNKTKKNNLIIEVKKYI